VRILLVEDNQALAENLSEVFSTEGHDVEVATEGARALEAASRGFDLALLDVRLPDMLGTALLPHLKARAPDSEVIVTTGNADLESAIEAVRGGAFAYLTKPVGVEELLLTAGRALERVQLRRLSRDLQARLEESDRRHREILENVQAMIVALDVRLHIGYVNQAFEEVSGWSRAELLGKDYFEIFAPPGERDARRAWARGAWESGSRENEVTFPTRSGSVRRVHMRWAGKSGGQLLYGMGHDVTRQREAERKAMVSEKLAAVGTLAAGLAHEIRNPLNAAGLQLSLLARRVGKLSEGDRRSLGESLDLVRTELSRLDSLLGDFLAFARPRDYARQVVDLTGLVQRLVMLEQEAVHQSGRELAVAIEAGVSVRGEPDPLQQVLLNLIRNALEAARSRVSLRLFTRDGSAVIEIRDDGPGVPADVLGHLFEPFFTTKSRGTGLGLAIVHAIVSGHGGDVTLGNEGGGALARVTLPLASGEGA
jgi:PAS domain S-box-containing protein